VIILIKRSLPLMIVLAGGAVLCFLVHLVQAAREWLNPGQYPHGRQQWAVGFSSRRFWFRRSPTPVFQFRRVLWLGVRLAITAALALRALVGRRPDNSWFRGGTFVVPQLVIGLVVLANLMSDARSKRGACRPPFQGSARTQRMDWPTLWSQSSIHDR